MANIEKEFICSIIHSLKHNLTHTDFAKTRQNALLTEILTYEEQRRYWQARDIEQYVKAIQEQLDENDIAFESVYMSIEQQLKQDLGYIQGLDQTFQSKYNKAFFSDALRSNKMQKILKETLALVTHKLSSFDDILSLLKSTEAHHSDQLGNYRYWTESDEITVLDHSENAHGSIRLPILVCLLSHTYLALAQHLGYQNATILDPIASQGIDNSTLFHVVDLNQDVLNSNSSYAFNDQKTTHGYCVFDTAYRDNEYCNNARYKHKAKRFGPENTAAWIGQLLGLCRKGQPHWDNKILTWSHNTWSHNKSTWGHVLSTEERLFTSPKDLRNLRNGGNGHQQNKTTVNLSECLDSVTVRNPQRDVQAGDVYFDPSQQGSDSCGIVMDTPSAHGDIVTAGYTWQNKKPMDQTVAGFGFGLHEFNSNMCFFRLKDHNTVLDLNSSLSASLCP